MNAPLSTGTIQTTAPTTLWRVAAAFMHVLHALFGAPSDVAARHTLTLKVHRLMASWLRCGEAMMRRLLAIEAVAFAKPDTKPERPPRNHTCEPETPETWRVSFRCFTSARAVSPSKGGKPRTKRGQAQSSKHSGANSARHAPILRQDRDWVDHDDKPVFRPAHALAARYEALLRAFNNPLAYARRLSRTLHATPQRLRDLLRAPLEARDRVDHFTTMDEQTRIAWNTS